MSKNSENIKIMADMLRRGSTLTDLVCPVCSSPLFKLKNRDIWCISCQKRVEVIKEGEPELKIDRTPVFSSLESTILGKIQEIENQFAVETDATKLKILGSTLSTLLENLEKIRKISTKP